MSLQKLINTIYHKFYYLPNHPTKSPDTSLVFTVDDESPYLPIEGTTNMDIKFELAIICIYVAIWLCIMYFGRRDSLKGYLVGFVIGLILLVIETFFSSTITKAILLKIQPDNKPYPFIINVPYVDSVEKGTPVDDKKKYINYNPDLAYSGYKVLFDNKDKVDDTSHMGYIYTASKFLEKSSLGTFSSMNLQNYIEGEKYTGPDAPKDFGAYDNSTQLNTDTTMNDLDNLSRSAYYLCIIIITWAVYVTTSPWGSIHQLYWNILAFITALIGGIIVVDTYSVTDNNLVIYLKKNIIILAISFGITSVYIS